MKKPALLQLTVTVSAKKSHVEGEAEGEARATGIDLDTPNPYHSNQKHCKSTPNAFLHRPVEGLNQRHSELKTNIFFPFIGKLVAINFLRNESFLHTAAP